MKSRVGAAIVVLPETFDFECLHVATALENFAPLDVEKKKADAPLKKILSPLYAVDYIKVCKAFRISRT